MQERKVQQADLLFVRIENQSIGRTLAIEHPRIDATKRCGHEPRNCRDFHANAQRTSFFPSLSKACAA